MHDDVFITDGANSAFCTLLCFDILSLNDRLSDSLFDSSNCIYAHCNIKDLNLFLTPTTRAKRRPDTDANNILYLSRCAGDEGSISMFTLLRPSRAPVLDLGAEE